MPLKFFLTLGLYLHLILFILNSSKLFLYNFIPGI